MSRGARTESHSWSRVRCHGAWKRAGVAALASLMAAGAAAQPSPNGAEMQVNSLTSDSQIGASIAADGAGRFVVVWHSAVSGGDDTNSYSVQLQRYSAAGAPLGGQVQVNSYTPGNQRYPKVAARAAGDFVVVWQSYGSDYDSDGYSVRARRFDSAGTPVGAEFQVNVFTPGDQRTASVAVDPQGRFVVVWESEGSSSGDASFTSVQAQRYAADGTPVGSPIQANSYTTDYQNEPAVAMDAQGNFVVAWQSDASSYDSAGNSVQASIFDAAGTALSGQFQVNASTSGDQEAVAVGANAQGIFLVVWHSASSAGTDASGSSIQGQLLDAQGGLGDEFQVNTLTPGNQYRPAVAGAPHGDFVVAWESDGSAGTDSSLASIQARRLGESDFQVNTYTTSFQLAPAVAVDAAGNFVIAWESDGSSGTDTSFRSIHAQRYDELFRDGFEVGGSGRWSSTLP